MEKKLGLKSTFFTSNAFQQVLAFAGLALIFIFFSVGPLLFPDKLSPYFASWNNFVGILLATAVNGVLALGVTFVIVTGGIDLSVGTVMTFSAVCTALLIGDDPNIFTSLNLPLIVGVLGGILAGATCGFFNGVMVAKMKIPPFIATLGMMLITRGLSLVLANIKPIYFNNHPDFTLIATGSILGNLIPGLDIPNAVLIMFGAAIIAGFILTRTVLGRYNVALGSNEEATRLSGVNTDRWKIGIYALCGTFAGLAGVLIASRLNSAQPATGAGYEFDAIAAVVIGGTSLAGGSGTILGTIIGAFVKSVLDNGLRINSIDQQWQWVITGIILVGAVYLDISRRRRANK
jgi:ribose transport system permease protein